MVSTGTEDTTFKSAGGASRPSRSLVWLPGTIVLSLYWLGSAYLTNAHGRAYATLPQVVLGVFALMVGMLLIYPRRPRQLSLLALTLLLGLGLWAGVTLAWAPSFQSAWRAGSSLLCQVTAAGVVAAFLTDDSVRRRVRPLIPAAALALLVAAIWGLLASPDVGVLFAEGRLIFPTGSPSAAAGLYLVLPGPLLWLAIDRRERSPLRGAALGLAFGLGCLAYLAHSPAAVWAVAFSAPLVFLFTPSRLRLLFYLLVPLLLSIYAYPALDDYRVTDPSLLGARGVVFVLVVGPLVCAAAGTVLSLLERWIHISDRMRILFGLTITALATAGLVYAQLTSPDLLQTPLTWAREGAVQWRAAAAPAWSAFAQASSWGNGVGQAAGTTPLLVRVAADLGIFGLSLGVLVLLCFISAVLWPRSSSGWHLLRSAWPKKGEESTRRARWGLDPTQWGLETHILFSVILWLVGGCIDGSWFAMHSSLPILMLAAYALAQVDGWADVVFPALSRILRTPAALEEAVSSASANEGLRHGVLAAGERTRPLGFSGLPRAYRHLERRKRVDRRRAARARQAGRYHPPGPLSFTFRTALITLSGVCLILTAPLAAQEVALSLSRNSDASPERALTWATRAASVFGFSEVPFMRRGDIFMAAAERAEHSTSADRHAALLDNLALAVVSFERAGDADPTSWASLRAAALALERMAAAVPIAGASASLYAPGEAALSLADTSAQIAECALLRGASEEALRARALHDALLALARDPVNPLLRDLAARL